MHAVGQPLQVCKLPVSVSVCVSLWPETRPRRTAQVGEINIDNSLVVDQLLSKEDLVSMDKGCVCCSLRHDIVKALRELQRRAATRGSNYDCILLETTGLADPAPVAFTFFSNAWISANFRLDSIICLVDAQHICKVRARSRYTALRCSGLLSDAGA